MPLKQLGLAVVWAVLISPVACVSPVETVQTNIEIDTDDVDTLLDRYTDSRSDDGCDMRILIANEDAYDGFKSVIDSAERTIHIETLYFDNDTGFEQDMGMEFAQLLADKARQGIQVRIIIDGIVQALLARPEINETLVSGGVELIEFAPPISDWAPNYLFYRNHKKILIADGQQAVIGGSNYGARYMAPGQWRDTNVLLTGPVVTTLQHEFLRDWAKMGGQIEPGTESLPTLDPTGPLSIRSVAQDPAEHDFDVNQAILIALRLADDFVLMEAPYFNPTEWLLNEMLDAADRGVEIIILTNAEASMDIAPAYPVTASWFETMLANDIRVYLWDFQDRTMHSKVMVVDDKLAILGTHNFNSRSILWDTENVAVFTDLSAIEETDRMIRDDLAEPHVYEIDFDWLDAHPTAGRNPWELSVLLGPHF